MVANGEILEQSWNERFGKLGFQKARRRNGEIWHSIGGVVPRNSLSREINVEFFPDNWNVLENHSRRRDWFQSMKACLQGVLPKFY